MLAISILKNWTILNNPYHNSYVDAMPKKTVKENTGKHLFKNVLNPTCIDLSTTNSFLGFQNTTIIFTGISYLYKMVVTVMKITV